MMMMPFNVGQRESGERVAAGAAARVVAVVVGAEAVVAVRAGL
jgi:hypothetical protein